MTDGHSPTPWAHTHIDLLNERYGGQSLSCNDEFFAEAENLVKNSAPIFIDDKFTDRGKWMDGWETRRRRVEGHDWCILRLGVPGVIKAFDVDTTHFRGNAPARISIEGCRLPDGEDPGPETRWQTIIKVADVEPNSRNLFEPVGNDPFTHVRLNIFPDGGVARLRAYGIPTPDWSKLLPNELVDLAYSVNGGRAIACSDMFYSPMNNVIAPGLANNMGEGWETKRRRGPGNDWLILKLACPGRIARLLIDTRFFKGNFPESASIMGLYAQGEEVDADDPGWVEVLQRSRLKAHTEHRFQDQLQHTDRCFTHIKLDIFPDGGISRLRVFGYPERQR